MFSVMDAIPTPIQAIVDLFTTTLADVRFADLDASGLANLASEVRAAAEVVMSAQAALASARDALHERQEALLRQVHRAMAYARVYAENDESLSQRIDAIALPRPAKRARNADEPLTLSPAPSAGRVARPSQSRARSRKPATDEPTLTGVMAPAD
jgi:hypothetical protein